jgi:hypothetical protein
MRRFVVEFRREREKKVQDGIYEIRINMQRIESREMQDEDMPLFS